MKKAMFAIIVSAFAALACGETTSGTLVATTKPGEPTPTVGVTGYKVGDVIQVQDHTIVLNSADIKGDELVANFTVENKGSKEISVSSLLSFNAKNTDGEKLEVSMCGGSGLDGKVLAGDKLKGNICWKATSKAGVKIYYEASLFSSGAIVWKLE